MKPCITAVAMTAPPMTQHAPRTAPSRLRRFGRARGLFAALGVFTTFAAAAQSAAVVFKDADLLLGERLIRENRCAECHSRKVGGDGSAIFRPLGRVNTPGLLRGMVEQCNTELNLSLFPEEVTSISAVLNRDHYRFK